MNKVHTYRQVGRAIRQSAHEAEAEVGRPKNLLDTHLRKVGLTGSQKVHISMRTTVDDQSATPQTKGFCTMPRTKFARSYCAQI